MKNQLRLLAAGVTLALIAPIANIEPAKAQSVRINGCFEGVCFDSGGDRVSKRDYYRYRNSNYYNDYDYDYRRPRYKKITYYTWKTNHRGYDYYYYSGGKRYQHRKDGSVYLYFNF
jgi:hypothetical protein